MHRNDNGIGGHTSCIHEWVSQCTATTHIQKVAADSVRMHGRKDSMDGREIDTFSIPLRASDTFVQFLLHQSFRHFHSAQH